MTQRPALLLLALAACSGQQPAPPHPQQPQSRPDATLDGDACRAAQEERARVPSLLEAGRLDRALRVITHADIDCPASASQSAADRAKVVAELGLDEPSAANHAATGEQLLHQAEQEARAGKAANAQRLYDRAAVALVRETGGKLAPYVSELPHAVRGAYSKGRLVLVDLDRAQVFDNETCEERLSFQIPAASRQHKNQLELSRDGRFLATRSGLDVEVRLWDLDRQQQVAVLNDHAPLTGEAADQVKAPLVLGRRWFAWSNTERIHLWELAKGQAAANFVGHREPPQALWLSDDESRLVSTASHEVRVWDLDVRQELAVFELSELDIDPLWLGQRALVYVAPGDEVRVGELGTGTSRLLTRAPGLSAMAVSPDSKRVALGTNAGVLELWDVETAQRVKQLRLPRAPGSDAAATPRGLTFGADARTLVAGLEDQRSVIVDLAKGRLDFIAEKALGVAPNSLFYVESQAEALSTLFTVSDGRRHGPRRLGAEVLFIDSMNAALSEDASRVALTAGEGKLLLFDSRTWNVVQSFDSLEAWHAPAFSAPVFLPGNACLLWQGAADARLYRLSPPAHATPVLAPAVSVTWRGNSGASSSFFSVHSGGSVRSWTLPRLTPTAVRQPREVRYNDAEITVGRSGDLLVYDRREERATVVNATTEQRRFEEKRHSCPVILSDDGAWFSTYRGNGPLGLGPGKLRVYSTATGKLAHESDTGGGICPGSLVASGTRYTMWGEFSTSIHDTATATAVRHFQWVPDSDEAVVAFDLSEDGSMAALARRDGRLLVYEVSQEVPVTDTPGSKASSLKFSLDRRWLAATLEGKRRVELRSLPSGRVVATLEHAAKELAGVTFSPDGRYVTATSEGSIVFFSARDGQELASLTAFASPASALVTTPEGYVDFDVDPAGKEPISCKVGWRVLPFALCRERWQVPALLEKVLSGARASTGD